MICVFVHSNELHSGNTNCIAIGIICYYMLVICCWYYMLVIPVVLAIGDQIVEAYSRISLVMAL